MTLLREAKRGKPTTPAAAAWEVTAASRRHLWPVLSVFVDAPDEQTKVAIEQFKVRPADQWRLIVDGHIWHAALQIIGIDHLGWAGLAVGCSVTSSVAAATTARRFPPPWSVNDPDMKLGQDCFISATPRGRRLRRLGDVTVMRRPHH